jgi:hypothetical protein
MLDDDAFSLLAIPYGGPIEKAGAPLGADLQGEWFGPRTDIKPDWFLERPTLWHHGKDPSGVMGTTLVGKAIGLHEEEDGWWVDFWWKQGEKRVELIRQLGKKGAHIYGSSSTIPTLVRTEKSGEITQWPYIEQTLSTSPVNTYSYARPMKAVLDDFEANDIEMHAALKALLPALDDLVSDLGAQSGVKPRLLQAMSEGDMTTLERLADRLLTIARS